MIRNLLATTAIVTLAAAGGAFAQTAPTAPTAPIEEVSPSVVHAEGHLASNIIGETVYSSTSDDAENIGTVSDIVMSPDGEAEAVVIGVGGFLGIGKKAVAIEYSLLQWGERDGNRYLILETNREALEALPTFDVAAYHPMPADVAVGNTRPASGEEIGVATPAPSTAAPSENMAAAPADDTMDRDADAGVAASNPDAATTDDMASQDMAQDMATDDTRTSAIDRSAMMEVPATELSADNLIGTTVYGAGDENVGSIADVILSSDGQVDAVTIDVGGFLGIGAKEVAIDLDNLAFMRDGDDLYLYTSLTEEQLKAQPEYDASTFADNRDEQLLVIPR